MSNALSGRRILLTRPEGQVEPLAARLREFGAQVSHFPAIRITLTPPDSADLALVEQAGLIIFASTNAVRGLMAGPERFTRVVCHTPEIAAIGPATAEALKQANLEPTVVGPPPHNSEALLSTPVLKNPDHRHVIIVRGQSGREMLAEKLRRHGAEVHYLEVYRRDPPTDMLSFEETEGGPPEAVCVTSAEIARNLLQCITPEEKDALLQCPLIAGNQRIADTCRELGYTSLSGTALNPGDDAMIDTLTVYFSTMTIE